MHDDGGPAFPPPAIYGPGGEGIREGHPGMSLRDWFAGQALAGMHASLTSTSDWPDEMGRLKMARIAYAQADAMIAARATKSVR